MGLTGKSFQWENVWLKMNSEKNEFSKNGLKEGHGIIYFKHQIRHGLRLLQGADSGGQTKPGATQHHLKLKVQLQ